MAPSCGIHEVVSDVDLDKVLDRVRKLLRLSESANVHEAALAAARAQALMERHRIDAAALDVDDDGIRAMTDNPLEVRGRMPRWALSLASIVAETNDCRLILRHHDGRKIAFLVGRTSDTTIARIVYEHLAKEVERLTRKLGHGKGRRWCTSFRLGTVATIGERLDDARAQTRASARREAQASLEQAGKVEQALARIDARAHELDAWIEANLRARTMRPRVVRADADGFAHGRAAGHSVELGPPRGRRLPAQ